MLLLILRLLAEELRRRRRMSRCQTTARDVGEIFRLDAKAEGKEVATGGWLSLRNFWTGDSPCFAFRLNRRNAEWAFS